VSDDDNYPLSTAQDKKWPAPKLIVLGAITLLIGIGIIYTAASTIGEHANSFHHLEFTE
jgi:hypothetical protein